MQQRVKAWVWRNLDVLAFGAALSSVGPLLAWWSVLVRRNILRSDTLAREQFDALDPAARAEQLAQLKEYTERQLFMITGESVVAGLLVVTLAVVLFVVARQRQNENRRMQTMLQLTSHQLKTPIAGVRMLLQSLTNGAIPPELQAQFLQQGIAECDRLEHLVETILAYQRAVVRRSARIEAIPTEQLIGDILVHRKHTSSEEVEWTKRAPSLVRCDPDAVRVVMENLLDNARKYGGGKVELVEGVHGARWRIEVRDRGQGFDPSERERLFEPFERGGGTGVAHGSGLGLHIARQLARQMGGDLTASSDGKGKGSVFVLALPISTQQTSAATEVAHG